MRHLVDNFRPTIAYAAGRLGGYASQPYQTHWSALVRVLRYLKRIIDYGLYCTRYPDALEGYNNAKITRSTMEVELLALEGATKEAEWLRSLLLDIPLMEKLIPAMSIHCDS